MRKIPLALAGVLLATVALAQTTPPPASAAPTAPAAAPPAPGSTAEADLAPPPPPPAGLRGDRPPPPPPLGAAVKIDRGPNGTVHVDVHCARADTTKDCADIASRLFAETGAK